MRLIVVIEPKRLNELPSEIKATIKGDEIPKIEEIEQFFLCNPDCAWGGWSASGKKKYPLAVLKLALSPMKEEKDCINITAHAAQWSIFSLCKQQSEVHKVIKEYFQTDSKEERTYFFNLKTAVEFSNHKYIRQLVLGMDIFFHRLGQESSQKSHTKTRRKRYSYPFHPKGEGFELRGPNAACIFLTFTVFNCRI